MKISFTSVPRQKILWRIHLLDYLGILSTLIISIDGVIVYLDFKKCRRSFPTHRHVFQFMIQSYECEGSRLFLQIPSNTSTHQSTKHLVKGRNIRMECYRFKVIGKPNPKSCKRKNIWQGINEQRFHDIPCNLAQPNVMGRHEQILQCDE